MYLSSHLTLGPTIFDKLLQVISIYFHVGCHFYVQEKSIKELKYTDKNLGDK